MSKKKRSSSQKIFPNSSELNPCPFCQIPLHFLKITGDMHLMRCENNSWEGAKECQDGIDCFSSDFHHYWDLTHHILAKHRGLHLNTPKSSEADADTKESPRKKAHNSPRAKKVNTPRKSPEKKKQNVPKKKAASTACRPKRKHKVLSDTDCSEDDFITLPKNSQMSSQTINESLKKKAKVKKSQGDLMESGDDSSDSGVLFLDTQGSSTQHNTTPSYSQDAHEVQQDNEDRPEDSYGHFLYSSSQDMFSNYPQDDNLETKPDNDELQTCATNSTTLHPYQWHIQSVEDEMVKPELTPSKAQSHKHEEVDVSPMKFSSQSDYDYPTPTKYLTQEFTEIADKKPEDYFKSQVNKDVENPASQDTTQNSALQEIAHNSASQEIAHNSALHEIAHNSALHEIAHNSDLQEIVQAPQVEFSDSSEDDCEVNSETGEILYTAKFEHDDNSSRDSSEKQEQVQDNPIIVMEDIKKVSNHVESIQAWKKILNKQRNDKSKSNTNTVPYNEPTERRCHTSTDRAPFYKLIPDTDFVVDDFKNGPVVNKNNYFLSHFHYDHYIGLNKHFSKTIHCSTITGELLKSIIRIDAKYIRTIDVGETKVINQVEVTALDANHCPGALMFVFKTLHGHSHLHTGDFRADISMQSLDILKNTFFEKVYLDTTYCNPSYNFPSQQTVLHRLVQMIEENHTKYPKTLYICGSYTIGKEKVYISILKKMKWNIYVESYKRKILNILNDETINTYLVANAFQAKLHVIAMSKLNNIHHLLTYYESYKSKYDKVVAIKPTGWTYSERNNNNINIKRIDDNISVYEISYSEHSSFLELCSFVKFLKYNQIVCTVNVKNSEKQVQMIDSCIKKKLDNQVTNTLNSYFTREKI